MDRDTLIDQVADWIDTQVIAELIVRHLENFGDPLTLENAKSAWYFQLEELGARIHGGG